MQIWKDYVEPDVMDDEARAAADKSDRVVQFKRVIATECTNLEGKLKFAAQMADDGMAVTYCLIIFSMF